MMRIELKAFDWWVGQSLVQALGHVRHHQSTSHRVRTKVVTRRFGGRKSDAMLDAVKSGGKNRDGCVPAMALSRLY